MNARNKMEEMVIEMMAKGEKLHGWAKAVAEEMALREMEEVEAEA